MLRVDKKDRQILFYLDQNARRSNAQIAKLMKTSKEVVTYRIKRMEESGIIEGYYALVDITKLGYLNGRIFIKFKNINPEKEKEIIEYFKSEARCWWVNSISGSIADLGVAVWAKDINDFAAFKLELLEKYRNVIESYNESIYSSIYIWRKNYLFDAGEKRKRIVIRGNSEKIDFDSYDVSLLSHLSQDARMPLVELANKVGLSPTATKHRIDRLTKLNVIVGFRPKICLAKIGHYWYKVEFKLDDMKKMKAMLSYFDFHPNIVYAYQSIGGGIGGESELEMEMEVENHEKFREIVDHIRSKFGDAIRTYIYYIWSSEHKIVFFPPMEFFKRNTDK